MRAGTLQVSGGTLETAWWGPGPAEAPTLVLLHEGLGSVALWRDVPERLAAATGWGVFAYSRFGYGNSDTTPLPRPMTYMHHEAQVVLPEVLRAAGIERAVLIGHSDGGSIAAIYAGSRQHARSRRRLPPRPRHHRRPLLRRGPEHRQHPPDQGATTKPATCASAWRATTATSTSRSAAGTTPGSTRGSAPSTSPASCRTSSVPILALQGADDPYGTDEQLRVFAANVRAPITTQPDPRRPALAPSGGQGRHPGRHHRLHRQPAAGSPDVIDFQTDPTRYRHWKLSFDGPVATLTMDVDPAGGLMDGYELKLNSYDLGVDIELADAVQRLRFEHPEVKTVVLRSGKEGVFCAGANIRMLGKASHGHKVNFCKFTNETRLSIEDASENSGQIYLAAIAGSAAGGGYELAVTADHIMLIDDRRSSVSLPELPLLAVLPGTGGLTRLTDKRRVRRDRADIFCTAEEGVRGKRAVEWRLVDEVVPPSAWEAKVARTRPGTGRAVRPRRRPRASP